MHSGTRQAWAATHPGLVRSTNQDRALIQTRLSIDPTESWHDRIPAHHAWAAIADGMGGHEAGNIASDITITAIAEGISAVANENDFANLSRAANRRIFEAMHNGAGRPRMGSTLVAASIKSDAALIVNVGDSRAYHVVAGRLHLVSADHIVRAQSSAQRYHALTQSLGGRNFEMPISPHMARLVLGPRDALLLCSDGLTDMVDKAEIEDLLFRNPHEPAIALVRAALAAGGRDNVTVVLVGPPEH